MALPEPLKERIQNGGHGNPELIKDIKKHGHDGIVEAIILNYSLTNPLGQKDKLKVAIDVIKGLPENKKIGIHLECFNKKIQDKLKHIIEMDKKEDRIKACEKLEVLRFEQSTAASQHDSEVKHTKEEQDSKSSGQNEFESDLEGNGHSQVQITRPEEQHNSHGQEKIQHDQEEDIQHDQNQASPNALIQFAVNNPWLTAAIVGMIAVSVVALTFATVPSAAAIATSFGRFLGASASNAYATGATAISGGAGVLATGITFFALKSDNKSQLEPETNSGLALA